MSEAKTKKAVPTAPVEALADYIARVEGVHLHRDVVAVEITHPEVQAERVHPGIYGGIRLKPGDLSVRYSDGTAG